MTFTRARQRIYLLKFHLDFEYAGKACEIMFKGLLIHVLSILKKFKSLQRSPMSIVIDQIRCKENILKSFFRALFLKKYTHHLCWFLSTLVFVIKNIRRHGFVFYSYLRELGFFMDSVLSWSRKTQLKQVTCMN